MRTVGIVVLLAGLFLTLYSGITYIAREEVGEVGNLHFTRDDMHTANWQPSIGIGVMIIGGTVLFLARKRSHALVVTVP